ncbi:periplasmic heavy metal sensor [candidate division KSB1 bacterium]|nr:periplasmic heavy metal sensor [candidate division KSB1 bacterium]
MFKKSMHLMGILVLILTSLSLAQPPRLFKFMGHKGRPGPGLPNLTAEQETKIKSLRLDLEKELTPLQLKVRKMRIELQELMIVDQPNLNQINSKLDDISKQRLEIAKKFIKHRLAVRELLTAEQRIMFDKQGRGHGGRMHGFPACQFDDDDDEPGPDGPVWIEEPEKSEKK